MFLPCPHCGFLVALILPSAARDADQAPLHCPRCDGGLSAPTEESTPATPLSRGPAATAVADRTGSADADADADADAASDVETARVTPRGARREPTSASVEAADVSSSDELPVADTAPDIAAPPATSLPPPRTTRPRRAPSFVRGATAASATRRRWPWIAATVGLGLLLALQLLLAQRHELAASARWRPLVAGICSVLPCAVPPWREPRAFTMLSRNVQPSRAAAGVLVVDAEFRNDARWPQPWPDLVLSLSDVEGQTLATRAFTPAQYRQRPPGAADRLAPGQVATARLQVREPAPGVVAFTFDFQ